MWQKLNSKIEPKIVEVNNSDIQAKSSKAAKLSLPIQLNYIPKNIILSALLIITCLTTKTTHRANP